MGMRTDRWNTGGHGAFSRIFARRAEIATCRAYVMAEATVALAEGEAEAIHGVDGAGLVVGRNKK